MKIDILAIGPHPDDMEIFMGGALLKWASEGKRTAVCDLTQGEMSTNGDVSTRLKEAEKAGKLLGLSERKTLNLGDGNILNTESNRIKLIELIRAWKPEIVFTTMEGSRHPDHHHTYQLVKDACFLGGIAKVRPGMPPYRPNTVIQTPEFFIDTLPSFVVDITDFYEKKKKVIQAYASQVLMPGKSENEKEANTLVKSQEMWDRLEAKAAMTGAMIGVKYGEPFYASEPPKVDDVLSAFGKKGHR